MAAAPARIPVTEREWGELSVRTLGHSNHSMEHFLDLLRRHAVDVVVDVRSSPYSKYAKQFDKEPLVAALREVGFQYVYMGAELGGVRGAMSSTMPRAMYCTARWRNRGRSRLAWRG